MLHAFIQQNDCQKSKMQPRRAFLLIPPPAPVLATRFLCGAPHMLAGTVIMQHVHGYDSKDMLSLCELSQLSKSHLGVVKQDRGMELQHVNMNNC